MISIDEWFRFCALMTPVFKPMVLNPPKKRACSIFMQRSITTSRPACAGAFRGFFVDHAELHPDHFRARGDGLIHDRRNGRRLAENIDDFDRARHIAQRRIRTPAQHFFLARIYRNHIVTLRQHINRREMAGPERIRRQPHHRDAP